MDLKMAQFLAASPISPARKKEIQNYVNTQSKVVKARQEAQEKGDQATLFSITLARLFMFPDFIKLANENPIFARTFDDLINSAHPENTKKDENGKDAYDRALDLLQSDLEALNIPFFK